MNMDKLKLLHDSGLPETVDKGTDVAINSRMNAQRLTLCSTPTLSPFNKERCPMDHDLIMILHKLNKVMF